MRILIFILIGLAVLVIYIIAIMGSIKTGKRIGKVKNMIFEQIDDAVAKGKNDKIECRYCGTINNADHTECKKCGAPLVEQKKAKNK